jgi:UDP-N-acetylglucosamine acyltransferase
MRKEIAEEAIRAVTSNRSEYTCRQGAWVHASARLADDVVLEPGAVIGADVELGAGCWIGAGAVIYGPTRLGKDNRVHAGAVLGGAPQDVAYDGEPTRLEVGDRNVFREGMTVHRASTKERRRATIVGNDNYFMAYSHVGHDCVVEDHVILANGVLIAGHSRIKSRVNMGGGSAIAQFVTIGRLAFVGALGGARKDLEPFLSHDVGRRGPEVEPTCVNEVGLKRAGLPPEVINNLRTAFKVLYLRKEPLLDMDQGREEIALRGALCNEVEELLDFVARKRASKMGRQRSLPTK